MMKLSKKIMLFEEFAEVKTDVKIDDTSIRTEIASDVDSIINKLEDLAKNLETETTPTNESNQLNEGSGAILGADLYMIPIVAGGAAVAGVAYGGKKLFDFIKKTGAKKKAKKDYAKVDSIKTKAAQLEAGVANAKFKGVEGKAKDKIDKLSEKIENQNQKANDLDSTITDKYKKYGIDDFLAVLRAETRKNVAEIMLAAKLSDSAKERFEQELENANQSISNAEAEANAAQEAAKEADQNTPNAKKITELEKKIEEYQKQLDNATDDEKKKEIKTAIDTLKEEITKLKGEDSTNNSDKTEETTDDKTEETTDDKTEETEVDKTDNSKDGMLKRIDALIKNAEKSGNEEKLKKAKELKARIEAKESLFFNYKSETYLLEAQLIALENQELI
jgi:hypothetical protein